MNLLVRLFIASRHHHKPGLFFIRLRRPARCSASPRKRAGTLVEKNNCRLPFGVQAMKGLACPVRAEENEVDVLQVGSN